VVSGVLSRHIRKVCQGATRIKVETCGELNLKIPAVFKMPTALIEVGKNGCID